MPDNSDNSDFDRDGDETPVTVAGEETTATGENGADSAEEESFHPFDTDEMPYRHQNVPAEQPVIDAPASGQLAFDFELAPPDTGHGIDSPDLTDPAVFANVATSYAEIVRQRRAEGTLQTDGDTPEDTGAMLEQPTWSEIGAGLVLEPETTSAEASEQRDPSAGIPAPANEQADTTIADPGGADAASASETSVLDTSGNPVASDETGETDDESDPDSTDNTVAGDVDTSTESDVPEKPKRRSRADVNVE